MNSRIINEKMRGEFKKSIGLRNLGMDKNINFKRKQELTEEQNKHYQKWMFLKNLGNAVSKLDK